MNRDRVIKDCFLNLKYEGIYIGNEEFADELIKDAQLALNLKDNKKLLEIINQLYEIDQRIK